MASNRSLNDELKTSTLHKGYKWVPGVKNVWGLPMQVQDHIWEDLPQVVHVKVENGGSDIILTYTDDDVDEVPFLDIVPVNLDDPDEKHVYYAEIHAGEGWGMMWEKYDQETGDALPWSHEDPTARRLVRVEGNFKFRRDIQDYG